MKVQHLFNKLNETFPLRLMGESFTGSHSLTCRDGQVELAVWTLGKVFVFGLTEEDMLIAGTEQGCDQLILAITAYLNQSHENK